MLTRAQRRYWFAMIFGLLAGTWTVVDLMVAPNWGWSRFQQFLLLIPILILFIYGFLITRRSQQLIKQEIGEFAQTQGWQLVSDPPANMASAPNLRLNPKNITSVPPLVESFLSPDQRTYLLHDGWALGQSKTALIFFSTLLDGSVDGWLHLEGNKEGFAWPGEVDLESNDYNITTHTRTSNKELPVHLLSPDIMAWYLDLPLKPWVHVEGRTLFVGLDVGQPVTGLEQLLGHIAFLQKAFNRSGALQKI